MYGTRKYNALGERERIPQTMGVTISTHNGSAVAREHNIRNLLDRGTTDVSDDSKENDGCGA